MWRIREKLPKNDQFGDKIDQKCPKIRLIDLKRAIIKECGYSPQTVSRVKSTLVTLGWIKTKKQKVLITGKDLEETY